MIIMKLIIGPILLSLIFSLSTGTIHAEDLGDGFLGIKWETNLSGLEGYVELGKNGNVTYFANPKVVHVINDIKVPQVVYGSYLNKFFAVYINIESIDVYSQMKHYITEKYGSPKLTMTMTQNSEQTIHTWKHKDTKIKLKLNHTDGKMKLAFYYTPLSVKVNEDLQEAFQETSGHIFQINKERAIQTLDLMKF